MYWTHERFKGPGLNFINVLHTAFTSVDPKSVKRYWQLDWVLTLWGATGIKDVHKYVDGIDNWSQFHQHFTSSFCAIFCVKKLQSKTVTREKLWKTLSYKKAWVKCWWNWDHPIQKGLFSPWKLWLSANLLSFNRRVVQGINCLLRKNAAFKTW